MAWQWYHDTFEPGEVHLHALTGVIATRKTKYQTVEIVESEHYGKMLILDGDCQSSVKDEYIYHECLNEPDDGLPSRPAQGACGRRREGASLRELLRFKSVEHIDMCDIDEEANQLYEQYLPGDHQGAFHDPKVSMHFEDARAFIERQPDHSYSVIIEGPDRSLRGWTVYRSVHQRVLSACIPRSGRGWYPVCYFVVSQTDECRGPQEDSRHYPVGISDRSFALFLCWCVRCTLVVHSGFEEE